MSAFSITWSFAMRLVHSLNAALISFLFLNAPTSFSLE
jgi:hypothetical protein